MLNINSVTLMLLEHSSCVIQVYRKKKLFDCSHWQMTTTNSLTSLITARSAVLLAIASSLLPFLHFYISLYFSTVYVVRVVKKKNK